MSEAHQQKAKKKQGLIRWNAIIPFLIFSFTIYLYFVLFFDIQIKNAIEWLGYKVIGSEVNVGQFKSSFLNGNVQLSKIQITSKEAPEFNSIELGTIKFDLNWNALLKVKFVIEEIAIEGIQFMSARSHIGRVAPPEPISNEPSFSQKLADSAVNKLDKENQNNIIGDTAQFLKTGKFDQQIQNIQDQISSKKLIDNLSEKWKTKQANWSDNLQKLPSTDEINRIKDKFALVKLKDFESLDELSASVKEGESLIKEIDSKSKQVVEFKSQFDNDLKSFDQDIKSIESQIKKDIDLIKSRFQIPKIDAASFAKQLFISYLSPYFQKLDHYKALAQKYLPPKYAKLIAGEKTKSVDTSIQPLPRSKGTTYEFPIQNGYPLFWIQKIKISSVSNSQADFGDIIGQITDITSNQAQVGRPTKLRLDGDFKRLNLNGIKLIALFDNLGVEPIVKFDFSLDSYPIENLILLESKDGQIKVSKTQANLVTKANIVGFKNYDLSFINTFQDANFSTEATDSTISELLKNTFGKINKFDLQASAKGDIKDLDISIKSSLGEDLENAFQNLLQNKIKEANEKIKTAVNTEIDKLKGQLTSQIEIFEKQTQTEINRVQSLINEQKKQADEKIVKAKKEFENKANKAKKDAEDQVKKQLEQEAKKQAEELKKKLGF